MIGRTGASTGSAPSSANAFPIALGKLLCVVPNRHTSRQVHMSMSKWALVLLRHDRRFQVFRPAIPRKSSHFLLLTDHESFFQWHAVQRSRFLDAIFRENDLFVCHWPLANPDSMAPSLIQIACWHGCVLVHHSFSEWQHFARVRFPKNTHKRSSPVVFNLKSRQAPCCVSNQPRYQDAVAW